MNGESGADHDSVFLRGIGKSSFGPYFRASDGYVTNGQYGEGVRVEVGRNGIVKLTPCQRGT